MGIYGLALGNIAKFRNAREDNQKDRESVKKDKKSVGNGIDYLAEHKKLESVDETPKFSSPPTEQENEIATNSPNPQPTETYNEKDLWSTLETPTSKKMGWKRPGISTMVSGMRYNPNTQRLNVQYRDKQGNPSKVFPYENVSPEEVEKIVLGGDGSIGHSVLSTIFTQKGTTKNDQIENIEEGM